MRVLVTGATGYLGSRLAADLAQHADFVNILYRDKMKVADLKRRNVSGFQGSLLDPDAVSAAMNGCTHVYHVAAMTSVWEKDAVVFDRVNVEGTEVVLRSALRCAVERLVFTSTAGVFGPSSGRPIDEHHVRSTPPLSDYDRTKALAEDRVREYVRLGLDAVIVNPTRIFGPSSHNPWASLNGLIRRYVDGTWHVLPGNGRRVGNYVYIDDVVEGHKLAMTNGGTGERYLLAGENLSYSDFFAAVGEVCETPRRLVPTPVPIMKTIAGAHFIAARILGSRPRITPAWVDRFGCDYEISHRRASRELGYAPRPVRDGLAMTASWIQTLSAHAS